MSKILPTLLQNWIFFVFDRAASAARRANLRTTNAVKPGKRGAFNQMALKNHIDARKLNERFRADETVEAIELEHKDFSFLYGQGDTLIATP